MDGMSMKAKILVMYAGKVDIAATKESDAIQGMSVEYYFFGENGEQIQSKLADENVGGFRRNKVFMDMGLYKDRVTYVPGIYDGVFSFVTGSDGKPVAKLRDIDFVAKTEITAAKSVANKQ